MIGGGAEMDHLFTPWRYTYVSSDRPASGCVFCRLATQAAAEDEAGFVVHRAAECFVVLNIYPYNTGHVMVVPYLHSARLSELPARSRDELFELAARTERILYAEYHPDGMNLGMNLGRSAGAGIADHLHLHVVPRWAADTNFMTVSGDTRVLPEDLPRTWRRLQLAFKGPA